MGTAEDEGVGGGGREGGDVGEIGGGAGGDLGGEAEGGEALFQSFGDGLLGRASAAAEVEGEGIEGGEFEVGGEGFGELEEILECGGFGLGRAGEDEKIGAAGEGAGDGKSGGEVKGGGAAVAGEEGGAVVFVFEGGDDGAGEETLFRLVAEKGFQGERGEVEGEVDGKKLKTEMLKL